MQPGPQGGPDRDPTSSVEYFVISVAAELAGMHAQTLRNYDRLGLVQPRRTRGGGRRYSHKDVERLREIQRLSQDEGVNLAGIKSIIELTERVDQLMEENVTLRRQLAERAKPQAPSRELILHEPSTAVVLWKPRPIRSRRSS
ncbi:heat shock protein transcriptional repressor HspR [Corynebacterium ulceribovis]|uniref:heat shock protein transcriptional repressor HspR n=1 Tax=Corynebacterium ulceribovis TaxID=487732 RepID=UPI000360B2DA|nr:MerR family transcriptional regulator [Corynebacterium ulceribovis]